MRGLIAPATRSGRSKTTALKDRRTRSVVRIAPADAGRRRGGQARAAHAVEDGTAT